MSGKASIMLALAQVWILVMGALSSRVLLRVLAEPAVLPATTEILVNYGFALLSVPLLWICFETYARVYEKFGPRARSAIAIAGWVILITAISFVAHGLLKPLPGCTFRLVESSTE